MLWITKLPEDKKSPLRIKLSEFSFLIRWVIMIHLDFLRDVIAAMLVINKPVRIRIPQLNGMISLFDDRYIVDIYVHLSFKNVFCLASFVRTTIMTFQPLSLGDYGRGGGGEGRRVRSLPISNGKALGNWLTNFAISV